MRCGCGYLPAAMCRLFAYGPADATAIPEPHRLLPHLHPDWFYLSGTSLPGCPGKQAVKRSCRLASFRLMFVCVCHKSEFYQNGWMDRAGFGVDASFYLPYLAL